MKLTVLKKEAVIKALKMDNTKRVDYNNITAKVYLVDGDLNRLGAIRFETYLKMTSEHFGEKVLSKVNSNYSSDYYYLSGEEAK